MSRDGTVLLRRRALGDVVLLGAVTGALPGPVTVVTEARYLDLAARLVGVDRVLPWEGARSARGTRVDLQGRRRLRADRRIRKRSVRRRLWLWWGLGGGRPPVPALYGEACGVTPRPPPWIAGGEAPRDVLALVPGASAPPKRPDPELLAAVGRAWPGPVVVLGGPGEEPAVERVVRAVPGAEGVVERGFARTIDVLLRTRVAVAGDTGPMHLAGACGAAVVALFGPTHPADGFFVYPGEVVQRELGCRPCTLHRIDRCPLGVQRCLDLRADDVIEAVRRCAG